jgi:hypothetical protein
VADELRVGSEAVDRADLGEQLGGGDCSAAGQLKQRRRRVGNPLLELLVELSDRPVELPAVRDELAREPRLRLLRPAGEPAPDALQVRTAPDGPTPRLSQTLEAGYAGGSKPCWSWRSYSAWS